MGRPKGTGRNVDTKTRSVTIQLDMLEESLNAVDFLKTNLATPRTFIQLLDHAVRDEHDAARRVRRRRTVPTARRQAQARTEVGQPSQVVGEPRQELPLR